MTHDQRGIPVENTGNVAAAGAGRRMQKVPDNSAVKSICFSHEGHPPQGLSEGWRVNKLFRGSGNPLIVVIDPPRGRPFGAATFISSEVLYNPPVF